MTAEPPVSIETLLSSLTLEEKVSLLAGRNFWETVGIPEKGIPALKTSDGPNGARGGTFRNGTTAACFPASVLLAASWDPELVHRIGNALAEETKTKGASVLLAPTVCLHRHPLGGRNFESFSEDPYLAGVLATEYIEGVQENGVAATIKHFAANEQETKRFTINANVSERALRELYMKPFELAIKKARPLAVMTSYNLINGVHADANKWLIDQVLRNEWGFNGLVMSDWGGTNTTAESINAGLDLEMPGPTVRRKIEDVKAAVEEGKVSEETINERVTAVLRLLDQTGTFQNPTIPDEKAIDKPEHRALIREAGGKGMTLLKNEGNILPLKSGNLGKIAVFGLAKQALAHGGGSAGVNAHYKITPWEALQNAIGDRAELEYSEGAQVFNQLPTLADGLKDDNGQPGLSVCAWLPNSSKDNPPDIVTTVPTATYAPVENKCSFATLTGNFTPTSSGSHYLEFSALGRSRLLIDSKEVAVITTDASDPMAFLLGGAAGLQITHPFTANQTYTIRIETYAPSGSNTADVTLLDGLLGINLGFMTSTAYTSDLIPPAVALARSATTCLIFTGNTTSWETEGRDMLETAMRLPNKSHSQDKLINAVAAANPNTIVINSTGVAMELDPWIDSIPAFLQTWFPGQESGNAITDILTGTVTPSGKLPISWPKKISDCPAYGNFPGDLETLQVNYAEDIYMGYKHFDQPTISERGLRYPFGFGLSYTTFTITSITLNPTPSRDDGKIHLNATITNTGSTYPGSEVLQCYVGPSSSSSSSSSSYLSSSSPPTSSIPMVPKKLCGWTKTKILNPGESEVVDVSFPVKEACAYWDVGQGKWGIEKGEYDVILGTSAGKSGEIWRGRWEVVERGVIGP